MGDFKKGDVVICREGDIVFNELTIGKKYTIIDIDSDDKFDYVKVNNDKGILYEYLSFRFTLCIESNRNKVINNILE